MNTAALAVAAPSPEATARRDAGPLPAAAMACGFDRACPRCGGVAHRIRRELLDRVISVLVPVARYRCPWIGCNWEGVFRTRRGE